MYVCTTRWGKVQSRLLLEAIAGTGRLRRADDQSGTRGNCNSQSGASSPAARALANNFRDTPEYLRVSDQQTAFCSKL